MKHKIVFLDRATIEKNIVVRKPNFDHDWDEFDYTDHNDNKLILERLKGATIAIINKVPMKQENLKKLPELKMIAVAATGTDVVDKEYCRDNNMRMIYHCGAGKGRTIFMTLCNLLFMMRIVSMESGNEKIDIIGMLNELLQLVRENTESLTMEEWQRQLHSLPIYSILLNLFNQRNGMVEHAEFLGFLRVLEFDRSSFKKSHDLLVSRLNLAIELLKTLGPLNGTPMFNKEFNPFTMTPDT